MSSALLEAPVGDGPSEGQVVLVDRTLTHWPHGPAPVGQQCQDPPHVLALGLATSRYKGGREGEHCFMIL